MEALAAIGLTANIIQFVQVSYEFTTRVRQLCQSNGVLEDFADIERTVSAAPTKISELENLVDSSAPEKSLIMSYIDVSRRLIFILDQIKVKQNSGLLTRLRAARRAVTRKQEIEKMGAQLGSLMHNIILSLNIEQSKLLSSMQHQQASVENMNALLKHFLEGPQSKMAKALGYTWETENLGEHIRVDDGLGPQYILPMDLCLSQQAFLQILTFKFQSRKLPGLLQVQRCHLDIWNWEETSKIDKDTWVSQVKNDSGIKLSFVMCRPFGSDKSKCLRCFNPTKGNVSRRKYTECDNCLLQVRWVQPDDIAYLPEDVTIGNSPQAYTEFLRHPASKKTPGPSSETAGKEADTAERMPSQIKPDIPALDFVCHRLTMKWEPICNIAHRYMYCRCVARQSTPSKLEAELTILIMEPCPRHNNVGIQFRDYGDQNYHQDNYFDQFGGYNAFRGMIYRVSQEIFVNILGGERFLPSSEVKSALEALNCALASHSGLFESIEDYQHDINRELKRLGVPLPDHLEKAILEKENRNNVSGLDPQRIERFRESFLESPATRELDSILAGEWSGRFHWTVE